MKPVGKPDAGNPHVRFDERGGETGCLGDTAPRLYCISVAKTFPLPSLSVALGNWDSASWFAIALSLPTCRLAFNPEARRGTETCATEIFGLSPRITPKGDVRPSPVTGHVPSRNN